MISEWQTCTDSDGTEATLSMLALWMKKNDGSGGRENPGVRIEIVRPIGPSLVCPVLPLCHGKLVAVIQSSPVDPGLLQLLPVLPARLFSVNRCSSHHVFIGWRLPTLLMLPADLCPCWFVWQGLWHPLQQACYWMRWLPRTEYIQLGVIHKHHLPHFCLPRVAKW